MKAFAPHYSTQSCKQTFAWLEWFKRILASMSKRQSLLFTQTGEEEKFIYKYLLQKKPSTEL